MRVVVCGGRTFGEYVEGKPLEETKAERRCVLFHLDQIHAETPITRLAQGGARGGDLCAKMWTGMRGVPVEEYPADWRRHGRAAGPIRNAQMLREFQPALVLAFPGGTGTADMVWLARTVGVRVIEVIQP